MEIKTILKATILIAIFSLFLEISPKNILNYMLFLGISYILVLMYIIWKRNYKYFISDSEIRVRNFLMDHTILVGNVGEAFLNQGYFQRRFNLRSIYIISKGRNLLIKDLPPESQIITDLIRVLGNKFTQ